VAGVDLPTVKELMGHSTILMTAKYTHPAPPHARDAVAKLETYGNAPRSITKLARGRKRPNQQ